jgi:uncharacterized DUF497 family protein
VAAEFEFTQHARDALKKRNISEDWVRRAVRQPERVERDRIDPSLEHRMCVIGERDGRVLRVVVTKKTSPERVITAYFDRRVKGPL